MLKVLVISANFAGIDDVPEFPLQDYKNYDRVVITEKNSPYPFPNLSPRLKAKYFRCQTHKVYPDYQIYIWLDGRIQVKSDKLISDFLSRLNCGSIGLGDHGERESIQQEAEFIVKTKSEYLMSRYAGQFVKEEVEHYLSEGYPDTFGLFSTGIFIRQNLNKVNKAFDEWWSCCLRWSHFDQTALPYILWKHQLLVSDLNYGSVKDNDYFTLGKHKPKQMIFRDDDISCLTDLNQFKAVDAIFKRHGIDHTIAVIAKDIETNPALVQYVKNNEHIKVQLHCWEHIDYSENHDICEHQLNLGFNKLFEVFEVKPTVFFPPWNKTDDVVTGYARGIGMETSFQKISLNQLLRKKGFGEKVCNFHYWHPEDAMLIDPALRIYKQSIA